MSGFPRRTAALAIALAVPFCATQASADSERVFYAFMGHGAHDGLRPDGGLVADKDGNLYGMTYAGGTASNGIVFKVTPQGTETVLYNFAGGNDVPSLAPLIIDESGNLYGTAGGGDYGKGAVFRVTPAGTKTVLYAFTGGADGGQPHSELISDQDGNFYGTTRVGGANDMGTVFKLTPDGTETVLYSFKGGSDGANPEAGLWTDANGNLYGTTFSGGVGGAGLGTVFKILPNGTERVIHRFTLSDGASPSATLVSDGKGNLYGTAQLGGTGNCLSGEGCGVIFKIAKDDTFSTVYSFPNTKAGRGPSTRLFIKGGKRKVLYGTTPFGGEHSWGVAFKVTLDGKETILHSFSRISRTGATPSGPLTADSTFTHLFGETLFGGNTRGVIYVLKP